MLPKTKPLLRCAVALLCLAAAPLHAAQTMGFAEQRGAAFMETLDLSQSPRLAPDGALTFTLNLRFGTDTAQPVTSIAALVHYNSAKMEFLGISNIAPAATAMPNPARLAPYRQNPPAITLAGKSLTADTDTALPLAWFALDGIAAVAGATMQNPARMATLAFKWKPNNLGDQTHIAITQSALGASDDFRGAAVTLTHPNTATITATPAVIEAASGTPTMVQVTCTLTRPAPAETTCMLESAEPSINNAAISIPSNTASATRAFTITPSANPGAIRITLNSVTSEGAPLMRNPKSADIAMQTPELVVSPNYIATEEGGSTDFQARLNVRPRGGDVVVGARASGENADEVTVSPASLTFTANNWSQPQSVTVQGETDNLIDSDQDYQITLAVNGGATNYSDDEITVGGVNYDRTTATATLAATPDILFQEPGIPQSVVITAELSGAVLAEDTRVTLTNAGGFAESGKDYESFELPEITIPAMQASASATFSITLRRSVKALDTIIIAGEAHPSIRADDNVVLTVRSTPDAVIGTGFLFLRQRDGSGPFQSDLRVTCHLPGSVPVPFETTCTLGIHEESDIKPPGDFASEPEIQGATITIPPGKRSHSRIFTVRATQRPAPEDFSKRLRIVLTSAVTSTGLSFLSYPDDSSTIWRLSAEPALRISRSTVVTKEDFDAILPVWLSAPPWEGDRVVVDITSSNTERAVVSPASLTFTANNWNIIEHVKVRGVKEDEDKTKNNYTITVAVDNAETTSPSYRGLSKSIRGTIDNSAIELALLSIIDAENKLNKSWSTPEGYWSRHNWKGSKIMFRNLPVGRQKVVRLRYAGGTATEGVDYEIVHLPEEEIGLPSEYRTHEERISLRTIPDFVDEESETIIIVGEVFVDGELVASDSVTIIIEDLPPSIDLGVKPNDVLEAEEEVVTLTVFLVNKIRSSDTRVAIRTAPSMFDPTRSAVENVHYRVFGMPDSITIPAGQASASASFVLAAILDDKEHSRFLDFRAEAEVADSNFVKNSRTNFYISNRREIPGTAPGLLPSTTRIQTSEAGGATTFKLRLTAPPAQGNRTAVVGIRSDNPNEAAVDPASLTFTAANWDKLQSVTVRGLNDDALDGDQTYAIELGVVARSSAPNYHGKTASVSGVNLDDEPAAPAPLDADANGLSARDLLILGRHLLGVRGAALTAGLSAAAPGEVAERISAIPDFPESLDVNEDGQTNLADIQTIIAYMSGLRGEALAPGSDQRKQRRLEANIARLLR